MRVIVGAVIVYGCLAWLLAKRYLLHAGWKVAPILIAVPALAFTLNEWRWQHFQSELASAVRPVLAGRDAGFGCERLMHNFWSSQGRVGHVWFDADGEPATEAFLSGSTCSGVKDWMKHPDRASIEDVVAVHTVTHEAYHLAGVRVESDAECLAIAADAEVMHRLGASEAQAAAAVALYVTQVYPRLSDDYRAPCPPAQAVVTAARTSR